MTSSDVFRLQVLELGVDVEAIRGRLRRNSAQSAMERSYHSQFLTILANPGLSFCFELSCVFDQFRDLWDPNVSNYHVAWYFVCVKFEEKRSSETTENGLRKKMDVETPPRTMYGNLFWS